jgi:hypothetical protein
MSYVMTDQTPKEQMLEELRYRRDEIEAAIERLEAEDETVLLQPPVLSDF